MSTLMLLQNVLFGIWTHRFTHLQITFTCFRRVKRLLWISLGLFGKIEKLKEGRGVAKIHNFPPLQKKNLWVADYLKTND